MSMCFTIRHEKHLSKMLKLPRLRESWELQGLGQHIGSCNVSVSVSKTWVSSLVSISAQKVSYTSLV